MRYLFPLNPWNQQRQFEKPVWVYPAHLAMYATHLRNEGHEVYWNVPEWFFAENDPIDGVEKKIIKDDFQIDVPFNELPFPDRTFTDAKNKRWQVYGNYKFHPATHMMASNLCWWGKCTFCVDTLKLDQGEPQQTRSVAHVIEEIDDLIAGGYKEVFDDSGTFPIGRWLDEFCQKMNERPEKGVHDSLVWPYGNMTFLPRGYLGKRKDYIKIGCNLKPLALDYRMMKEAGFRFILVGVESANQKTLDIIKKGQHQINVRRNLKAMADSGLEPHLTSMFGYPWESHEEEMNTVRFIQEMLKRGYAKTAQASVYSPPRTKPDPNSKGHKYIPMIYDAYKSPSFWFHKLKDLRHWEDFAYLLRGARLVIEEKVKKLWV